jgi:hypothetical protein
VHQKTGRVSRIHLLHFTTASTFKCASTQLSGNGWADGSCDGVAGMVSGVPAWRRGHDLAHEMQTAGELAGLEGTISLWRTEHTGCCFRCAFQRKVRERRRDRFRKCKQRLVLEYSWYNCTDRRYREIVHCAFPAFTIRYAFTSPPSSAIPMAPGTWRA